MEFILTKKWEKWIYLLCYNYSVTKNDGLQEARIIEWELRDKQITDLHRENYFKKVLFQRITGYNKTKFIYLDLGDCGSDEDGDGIIDVLVQVKPFDELFFEYLINDIYDILYKRNVIAAEIFIIRVLQRKRWKEIRREYNYIPHNKFYGLVKEIKLITRRELCLI